MLGSETNNQEILKGLEQIKVDFVYNKLSCNIVSVGGSNDYAKLGTTHHCFEDISILSNYDDINLYLPSNPQEFDYLFKKNYKNNSVNYFRMSGNVEKKPKKALYSAYKSVLGLYVG